MGLFDIETACKPPGHAGEGGAEREAKCPAPSALPAGTASLVGWRGSGEVYGVVAKRGGLIFNKDFTVLSDKDFKDHVDSMLAERLRTMAAFTPDHRPLNMYAIYRADLEMPPGKLSAQTGHAFTLAYEAAQAKYPALCAQYKGTGNGTKIAMYAKNLGQLLRAYREMLELSIPCALIIDRGHVLAPNFDGKPIITALGIGPTYRDAIEKTLKRYTLAP